MLLKFGTAQALRFVADISCQLPSEIEMEDLYDSFWGSSSMVTSSVYWRCNIVRVTTSASPCPDIYSRSLYLKIQERRNLA